MNRTNRTINLLDIKNGLPGMDMASVEHCYVACMVCLHRNNHFDGVLLDLIGDTTETITLLWSDYFDEQIDRTWKDTKYTTEHGAICISAMLVKEFTDYTIIERSRKGTGFDYWLGYENNLPFQYSARLEISGIFKESEQNNVEKRFRRKKKQTNQSDKSRLSAYISIVEFSKPKAIFAKKIIIMKIRELHSRAMELAAMADLQKTQKNIDVAMSLYEESYSLEYEAAMSAYGSNIGEPSISVLLRSAASLAMSCKRLREAEKLIALALSGEPPLEIAEELRNLLENVNFYRHLEVKGTKLSDDEVQLVIAGSGVEFGYANN